MLLRSPFRIWCCVASVMVGSLLVLTGCDHASRVSLAAAPVQEATFSAETETVQREAWPEWVRAQGSLLADERVVIGARVAGRVTTIDVDLGATVEAGRPIARLEQADLELRVAQARAQLAQACAVIGLKPSDSLEQVNPEKSPLVRQERAMVDEARENFTRISRLKQQGAIADAELDRIDAMLRVSEAKYQSSLNSVQERLATIAVRRAELGLTEQDLADAVVLAPFAGAIEARYTAPGAYLKVGDPVATLVRTNPLRFRGSVPERHALKLQVGQRVLIPIDGEPQPRQATIARMSPALDSATRSLTFEANVENADARLKSGLFIEARIEVPAPGERLTISASAVTDFAGLEKVWRLDGQQCREQRVRTGTRLGDRIEILEGLVAGDRVVRQGRDGRAGRLVERQ